MNEAAMTNGYNDDMYLIAMYLHFPFLPPPILDREVQHLNANWLWRGIKFCILF